MTLLDSAHINTSCHVEIILGPRAKRDTACCSSKVDVRDNTPCASALLALLLLYTCQKVKACRG